jgi:leucyl/phenylalanyl-tRNA---protein transferase
VSSGYENDDDFVNALRAGKLDPELLLWGYSHGVFPMGNSATGRIDWCCPNPRGIIDLPRFHVPANLRRVLRRGTFRVTIDLAFERVVRACGNREPTWITDEIVETYVELYTMGYGHSVEAWLGQTLAGGLYGVAIGGAFFGESMFHTRTDASKVALAGLVQQLRQQGYVLLDTQYTTAHLARFGAKAVSREEYFGRLIRALRKKCTFRRPRQQTIEIA